MIAAVHLAIRVRVEHGIRVASTRCGIEVDCGRWSDGGLEVVGGVTGWDSHITCPACIIGENLGKGS